MLFLNHVFSVMDDVLERHDVYKVRPPRVGCVHDVFSSMPPHGAAFPSRCSPPNSQAAEMP